MSGGSHDYICYKIENELCGAMEDRELDELMTDIAELAHDLEWYHSSDISREDYCETVKKFKQKWFEGDRIERLKRYIDQAIKDLHEELIRLVEGG